MRKLLNINAGWSFLKDTKEIPSALPTDWEIVNVPHSWNNIDGMDGGGDYFRGTCNYAKVIKKSDLPKADCYYLEINGANSSADVLHPLNTHSVKMDSKKMQKLKKILRFITITYKYLLTAQL